MKKLLLTLSLCLLHLSLWAQHYFVYEGTVKDETTGKPVPFASVGLPQLGLGTVCNEQGQFLLKVPEQYQHNELHINALGYHLHRQLLQKLSSGNIQFLLKPANLQLATVKVRATPAAERMRQIIDRIPENYHLDPVRYTVFQRESEELNNEPTFIRETVIETYRHQKQGTEQFSIRRSRGMVTDEKYAKRLERTWIWVHSATSDAVTNQRGIFSPDYTGLKKYEFAYEDEQRWGDDTVLVISFKPKLNWRGKEVAGNSGKLYVHSRSLAVVCMEREANAAFLKEKDWDHWLVLKVSKCSVSERTLSRSKTIYQQVNGKWHLQQKLNWFGGYAVCEAYSEPRHSLDYDQLVITKIETRQPQQIPQSEQNRLFRNHYSDAPQDFNEQYWEQYNTVALPPAFAGKHLQHVALKRNKGEVETRTVNVEPELEGGVAALKKLLQENLKLPEQAVKQNISGPVELTFIVNPDGTLSDFRITRSLGHGCDEEAIRVLKLSKWRPGQQDGKPVARRVSLEITMKDYGARASQ